MCTNGTCVDAVICSVNGWRSRLRQTQSITLLGRAEMTRTTLSFSIRIPSLSSSARFLQYLLSLQMLSLIFDAPFRSQRKRTLLIVGCLWQCLRSASYSSGPPAHKIKLKISFAKRFRQRGFRSPTSIWREAFCRRNLPS
jgi:hypothetical protein